MISIDGVANSAANNTAIQEKGSAPAPIVASPINTQTSQNKTPVRRVQEDQVELSDQSKQLSQQLLQKKRETEKSDQNVEVNTTDKLPEKKTLSAVEIVKYFPPFLSSSRRQEILQNYPLLRKQIDQMTVPPPPDILAEVKQQAAPATPEQTVTAEGRT